MKILLYLICFTLCFRANSQCVIVAPVPLDFCYDQVITNIPSCCDVEWDATCQLAYDNCNGINTCNAFANVTQNSCYYQIINQMPNCCDIEWDATCNVAYYDCMGITSGCNADVSICTPGVSQPFTFNQNTPGPPLDYADPVGCATGQNGNDFGFGFIILYITQSGPLNLLIDGSSTSGFIDVVVYDIPDGIEPCDAVHNQNNEIGCNYATASDGCTQFGNDFPCSSSVPAPNVVAGQRVMVIVHDYSTESNTFTLELGPSGAQTGPPDATITSSFTDPVCNNDNPIQFTSASLGGTWIGSGISPSGMFDPGTAGLGIHTITYEIGQNPCFASDQITIEIIDCVNIPCSVTASSNSPICKGDSIVLNATSVVNGIYTWTGKNLSSTNQNPDPFVLQSNPGTYQYNVKVQQNLVTCVDSVLVEINPLPDVNFDFEFEELNLNEIRVKFRNNSLDAAIYIWNFDDDLFNETSNEDNPIHEYNTSLKNEFNVILKAISEYGCVDSTSKLVKHLKANSYFIPNSFSPNGDELNNQFKPIFTDPSSVIQYKLIIYNKWGEIIFESNDLSVGWDGTYNNQLVQNGTYNWFIEFEELKQPNQKKIFNGFINFLK